MKNYAKENHVKVLTFPHEKIFSTDTLEGVQIIRMPYSFRLSKGFISLQSLFYFIKYAFWADRIFVNLPNAEGISLAFIAKLLRKKVICIFHCDVHLGPSLLNRIIELTLRFLVKLQLRLSNKIIVTTMDYVNNLRWYGSSFLKKTTAILPPIETLPIDDDYLNQLLIQKGEEKWVGFVGRVAHEKGLQFLIDAISQIKTFPIRLLIAGPSSSEVVGEDSYAQKIITKIQRESIRYTHLGKLNPYELGSFYQSLDVFVTPSVNLTEALGLAQVEAMLIGKPVISSDLPGLRMPVQATGLGLLVKPRNSDDLKNKILSLCQLDSKYFQEKHQNAKQIFNFQAALKAYQQVLIS